MKNTPRILVLAAGLFVSLSVQAVGPTVSTRFLIQDPVTHENTPAMTAHLDQLVCLAVGAALTPDGDHSLSLTLYDGLGREADAMRYSVTAVSGFWGTFVCLGFNQKRDAPGTWWYVGELDGEPLFSESIEIGAAAT
jgi:hypothetical protein